MLDGSVWTLRLVSAAFLFVLVTVLGADLGHNTFVTGESNMQWSQCWNECGSSPDHML